MTTTDLPAAMTDERLESIEQAHVGDYLGYGWTQDYIEADGGEPAYYKVATADGTTVATMPDWAGGIALFLAEAHDAVPQLIAEIRRLRATVADLADDAALLNALQAMGVDNWDGYSAACRRAEG